MQNINDQKQQAKSITNNDPKIEKNKTKNSNTNQNKQKEKELVKQKEKRKKELQRLILAI